MDLFLKQAPYEQRTAVSEAYVEERAYDARRTRRRVFTGLFRTLLLVLSVPLLVAVVFIASYALTCILDGATPEELVEAFATLIDQIRSLVW